VSEIGIVQVVARLETLERENRMLKRCILVAIVLVAALFIMAQAPSRPRTLEAERLVIHRPNGKVAISLEATNDSTSAYFYTVNGFKGAAINVSSGGSRINVVSPKRELEAEMSANTVVKFSEVDKKPPVGREAANLYILRLSPEDKDDQFPLLHPMLKLGSDGLGMFDKAGKVLWTVP
jgi:hypothetical protein